MKLIKTWDCADIIVNMVFVPLPATLPT